MKIGILTYYGVHNYGAILQAYGLNRVLSIMGHDVEFLSFERNYDFMTQGAENKYNLSVKSIPFLTKYFFDNGMGTFIYNYEKKRFLDDFRNKKISIGKRYSDATPDAVVIGSDEVFSIDVGINPFFYGHNIRCNNILSYAATFGSTTYDTIIDRNCKELISSGIKRMHAVSVRDELSKNIVKQLTDQTPIIVCDPVILYGYIKEVERLKRSNKPKEKYILLYSYDRNCNAKQEIDEIRAFANKQKCKVYSVGYYHKWCDENIACSPIELLWYFINAEYVLTDTFHGSVLSIITNVNFSVVIKQINQKVEFLMSQYGLSSRISCSWKDAVQQYNEHIDYDSVNNIVQNERSKSLAFLKESLAYND